MIFFIYLIVFLNKLFLTLINFDYIFYLHIQRLYIHLYIFHHHFNHRQTNYHIVLNQFIIIFFHTLVLYH